MLERIKEDGIEQFLLNLGVTKDCLQRSKGEISQSDTELRMYYDFDRKITSSNLVPVNEILGISRAKGLTFFQILNDGLFELNDINIDKKKLVNQLKLLEDLGIEEFQKLYNEKMKIPFSCFKKDGEKNYFQITDGNHRCILAKVAGLKTIGSYYIELYNFNENKYKLYQSYKNKFHQLKTTIQNTEFMTDEDNYNNEIRLCIDYRDFNRQYIILGYFKNIAYMYPLKENEYIDEEIRVERIIVRLNKIKIETKKYIRKYINYPKFYLFYMKVQKKYKRVLSDKNIAQLIALKKVIEVRNNKQTMVH